MKVLDAILWRRLDTPGHDACRLIQKDNGWRLEGTAVFLHDGLPASLAYELDCDRMWRTQEGAVSGWIMDRPFECRISRRHDGIWTLNGQVAPQVVGCFDLDLGFTPATNLTQLRRIALEIGQAAETPVAWLDAPAGSLERLEQRYERRGKDEYWYESPRFDYAASLQVTTAGFVSRYPGLWEAEL